MILRQSISPALIEMSMASSQASPLDIALHFRRRRMQVRAADTTDISIAASGCRHGLLSGQRCRYCAFSRRNISPAALPSFLPVRIFRLSPRRITLSARRLRLADSSSLVIHFSDRQDSSRGQHQPHADSQPPSCAARFARFQEILSLRQHATD